jgi:hypothetical protein
VIKFLIAAVWVSAVTIGAALWSAQPAADGDAAAGEKPLPLLGGLDTLKTEVIPVPVLRDRVVQGYFLARLAYTAEPAKLAKLSVPAETLITDQVYTYLFGNPQTDFSRIDKFDVDALRNGNRDSINKRVGDTLLQDVMIDQIDFLSKDEIRDNVMRRRAPPAAGPKGGNKVPSPDSHH